MKKRNGFTLIELLAVIVILAIIALIAVPMVMKILYQAKLSAAEDSTYGIYNAAQDYIAKTLLENHGDFPFKELEFTCDKTSCKLDNYSMLISDDVILNEELEYKGKKVTSGKIRILNYGNQIEIVNVKINGFICKYENGKADCEDEKKISSSVAFATDDWETIVTNVKNGNISNYHVGDTRFIELDMDDDGVKEKYSLRIANTSTPSECYTPGFSQSACGFVIEFGGSDNPPEKYLNNSFNVKEINAPIYLNTSTSTSPSTSIPPVNPVATSTATFASGVSDIINIAQMNLNAGGYGDGDGNVGGWKYTKIRNFVNEDLYEKLPVELKDAIIETMVISGYGKSDKERIASIDKIYLLDSVEVYGRSDSLNNNVSNLNRQMDYYSSRGVTVNNSAKAKKIYNDESNAWFLRSAISDNFTDFAVVNYNGNYDGYRANSFEGISPAFRLSGPDVHTFKYSQFDIDDWNTIAANVRSGNTSMYHVGDTKLIEISNSGEKNLYYSLRIANMSTPDECNNPGYSQSACGFVVEFGGSISREVPIITTYRTEVEYNATASTITTNTIEEKMPEIKITDSLMMGIMNYDGVRQGQGNNGGWEYSRMRSKLSEKYDILPDDLKAAIIDTQVLNNEGMTTDKLYLLGIGDILTNNGTLSRQLDYYRLYNKSKYFIKQDVFSPFHWWLRTAHIDRYNSNFCKVYKNGSLDWSMSSAVLIAAPAFRIG